VHAHLCQALMVMLGQVAEVYDPADPLPPVAPLLDPETCPDWALGWLAQLTGTVLPASVTPDQARTLITSVSGWQRGSRAALRAAAGLFLTGTQTVYFRERDPTSPDPPYTLEVVTQENETPDPAAVQRALLAQKPGGIVLNYRTVVGWDYQQMTEEDGPYRALPGVFSTYRHLAYNEKGST
jgi:hypothetical protein